tara:strand:+ start:1098 stop:2249 length:1152 start_codon:yes stop_codon:yes gene_type:complete
MSEELVKGFRDYTGEEAGKRAEIKKILVSLFERYGFFPAETPVIENERFVKGDNEKDEAVSDVYTLKDKGKRDLALRYEFTFQLKRLMKNQKMPFRRYQIGPVFRDEPVSGNRTRQFIQCDADVLGSTFKDEAEVLSLVKSILKNLGIDAVIYVNNRKLLNEILGEQGIKDKEEVIKELDKLDKLPEEEVRKNLRVYGAEEVLSIFKKQEKYFERYKAYSEIEELRKYCKDFKVEFKFSPTLARGLSYYDGTIFEVKSKKIKETLFGGGSYIFNGIKGFGFGVSILRLFLSSNVEYRGDSVLIVSLNEEKKAIQLGQKLRKQGNRVSLFFGKPSKALEYANSYKIKKVIFVGKKEVQKKTFKVKDMNSGREKTLIVEKKKFKL